MPVLLPRAAEEEDTKEALVEMAGMDSEELPVSSAQGVICWLWLWC